MAAVAPLPLATPPDEQRMLLFVTWKEYVLMRDLLDGPSPKMTFIQGALELTSPSGPHEFWKTNIARFVELWALSKKVDLRGYGGTTFKNEAVERGAEPDECYLLGKKLVDYPEIVLEVIYTNPLLNKLDVYAAFGVQEVWVYRAGAFTIHRLDSTSRQYHAHTSSALLPDLDFALLARFVPREDTLAALTEFEARVRGE